MINIIIINKKIIINGLEMRINNNHIIMIY